MNFIGQSAHTLDFIIARELNSICDISDSQSMENENSTRLYGAYKSDSGVIDAYSIAISSFELEFPKNQKLFSIHPLPIVLIVEIR